MHSQRGVASEIVEFSSAPPAHHGARRKRGGRRASAAPPNTPSRVRRGTAWDSVVHAREDTLESTALTSFAKIFWDLPKPGCDLV